MQNRKKGESLVEVVVALGIIAFVFMGVVNIIASSITLNVSARQRTEAVAMVQKNLNEYLASNSDVASCTVSGRTSQVVDPNGCLTKTLNSSSDGACYWYEIASLNEDSTKPPVETFPGYDSAAKNFVKVISHGKWYTRVLGMQSFEVSRLMKN